MESTQEGVTSNTEGTAPTGDTTTAEGTTPPTAPSEVDSAVVGSIGADDTLELRDLVKLENGTLGVIVETFGNLTYAAVRTNVHHVMIVETSTLTFVAHQDR